MQRVSTIWFGILSLLFQSSTLAWSSTLACDDVVASKTDVVRLDGHAPLPKYPEVYLGGFKVSFTLSPKAASASDILVDELRLEVRVFSPGSWPEYSYKIGGDRIYGAGPPTPRQFHVALNGKEISRATWIKGNSGIVANSGNFLDTNDPDFQAFKLAATEPAQIEGTVLAFKAGVYDLVLRLGYQTNARPAECVLATVRVYQERDE
jgi:hypothetical protein